MKRRKRKPHARNPKTQQWEPLRAFWAESFEEGTELIRIDGRARIVTVEHKGEIWLQAQVMPKRGGWYAPRVRKNPPRFRTFEDACKFADAKNSYLSIWALRAEALCESNIGGDLAALHSRTNELLYMLRSSGRRWKYRSHREDLRRFRAKVVKAMVAKTHRGY